MLSEVANDGRSGVDDVRALASDTKLEVTRAEFITEANRSIQSNSRSEITGAARDWLHRGIDEAGQLAMQWCDLVGRAATSRAQSQNQWLSDRVTNLRTEVGRLAQDVLNELATLRSDAPDDADATSAQCLARSVHSLLDYLDIEHGPHHPAATSPVVTGPSKNCRELHAVGASHRYKFADRHRTFQAPALASGRRSSR